MRVYGYIKSDKLLQPQSDAIVVNQKEAMRAYALNLGAQGIDELFTEDINEAKKPFHRRKVGEKLFKKCERDDVILVPKIAWILSSARGGVEFLKVMKEKNISLHCLDIGGDICLKQKRKLVVFEGYAEVILKLLLALERNETVVDHGAAIRASKAKARKEGKYLGGPVPFGCRVGSDGRLEQNSKEQHIIAEILTMREKRISYRKISQALNEKYKINLSHEGVRRVVGSQQGFDSDEV